VRVDSAPTSRNGRKRTPPICASKKVCSGWGSRRATGSGTCPQGKKLKDDRAVPAQREAGVASGTRSSGGGSGGFRNPSSCSSLLSLQDLPREDVMVRQIEELLLLTCLGGFVAGITYAATLLH
jgi:hypothetical protein